MRTHGPVRQNNLASSIITKSLGVFFQSTLTLYYHARITYLTMKATRLFQGVEISWFDAKMSKSLPQ